jgi:hypothetical protein
VQLHLGTFGLPKRAATHPDKRGRMLAGNCDRDQAYAQLKCMKHADTNRRRVRTPGILSVISGPTVEPA